MGRGSQLAPDRSSTPGNARPMPHRVWPTPGEARETMDVPGAQESHSATGVARHGVRVRLDGVGKRFEAGSGAWVVRNVSLEMEPGEFLTIVGPSGSGKTTLLRMIAGIVTSSEGTIHCDGKLVTGPSPERVMVFQSSEDALFDWLSVTGNVEFGLKAAKIGRAERERTARECLALVGLSGHEHKYPSELSGGMKQRLQIARALAVRPRLLVMDEPLASLDAQTRRVLQRELVRIWQSSEATVAYVTHDIREAVLLGQRVAVVSRGPAATVRSMYSHEAAFPRDEFADRSLELYRQLDAEMAGEVGDEL
ncbi:MAG: ABC transporter ATP-binding protein [Acidimicrobiales bacterium]